MTLISAVVLLGILIFVHELGHFLFAKVLGVKVLTFSLGFGPKVVGRTIGDTEYRISAFPLGGYVKMLGEEPGEELEAGDRESAYSFQPVWKRFSIVFFGPIFNIAFAALLFILIFMAGVPVLYPDIGKISEKSPAAEASLKTGDRIIKINGREISNWNDVEMYISESGGEPLRLTVKRDGEIKNVTVKPEKETVTNLFGEEKKSWEIGVSPLIHPVIGDVVSGSPADKAGLKKGDRIAGVEGTPVKTWQDMTKLIHNSPGRPLQFTIERDGRLFEDTITPEKKVVMVPGEGDKEVGLIGIRPMENSFIERYGPFSAISLGLQRTWDISVLTVVSIIKLIQRIIPAETIGGPILIVQMAGKEASQGALNFFTFMAVISINLGILNLLPIPILDGGHLMFLGIEAVRRRPVSEKVIAISQRVGLALLLTLMVFALYNDILRLFTGKMVP
jgi:regulator of sigma E protease